MPYTKKPLKSKRKTVHKKRVHRKKKHVTTSVTIPMSRGLTCFPQRYHCKMRTNQNINIAVVGAVGNNVSYLQTWYGNELTNGNGPSNNLNGAGFGAFGTSVPSGLYYLLGDSDKAGSNTGANAPYFKYRVHGATIKVTWIPDNITTQANTQLTVFPINSNTVLASSWSSMSNPQLAEQPFAKVRYCPLTNTTGRPVTVTNRCTTLGVNGEKYKATEESGQFDGTFNTFPSNLWMWCISLQSIAPSNTNYSLYGNIVTDIIYDVELFELNTFISTVPA